MKWSFPLIKNCVYKLQNYCHELSSWNISTESSSRKEKIIQNKMGSAARESDTDFITAQFLESALKSKVTSFTVKPGSNLGDNFTSILHGIEVQTAGSPSPAHLLLKTYPTDMARQKFLEESKIFRKELRVYDTLIPELTKFAEEQNRRNGGNGLALKPAVPTYVHGAASVEIPDADKGADTNIKVNLLDNYILMVDLRRSYGFKMADRRAGLDFDHCSLVVTELAKLHALNWSYCQNKGLRSIKEKFNFFNELFCVNKDMIKMMVNANFELIRPVLEEAIGAESEVAKGFRRMFEGDATNNFFLFIQEDKPIDEEQISNILRVKQIDDLQQREPWMVGSHGDCWVNNMLFKYDEVTGKPVQNILLDLQIVREACPTIDLVYFFYSSTTHAIRAKYLNKLLDLYAEKFQRFCKELNAKPFPGFSSAELKRRFHRSKLFGLYTSVMILPIITQNPETAVDLEKVVVDETKNEADGMMDVLKEMTQGGGGNALLRDRIVEVAEELYRDGII